LGDAKNSEGIFGLQRSFKPAGVESHNEFVTGGRRYNKPVNGNVFYRMGCRTKPSRMRLKQPKQKCEKNRRAIPTGKHL
jgi:hypothetical protein